jgi:hypothetical protein
MKKLLSFLSILLIVAGGVGLFITYQWSDFLSTIWLQGTVTYGAFLIIGLAIFITLLSILFEGD